MSSSCRLRGRYCLAGVDVSFSPCVCCCCHTRLMQQQADRLLACACHWLMCFVFILLSLCATRSMRTLAFTFTVAATNSFPSLKLVSCSAPMHVLYIIYIYNHKQPAKKVEQRKSYRCLLLCRYENAICSQQNVFPGLGNSLFVFAEESRWVLGVNTFWESWSHFGGWAEGGGGERGKCLIPFPCSRGDEMNSWFAFVDYVCRLQEM